MWVMFLKQRVADDFGYVIPGQKGKRELVNVVDGLPSTTWRQVMCNTSNNNGDGALTIVPLCRELSGSRDHTREAMEVKRTS